MIISGSVFDAKTGLIVKNAGVQPYVNNLPLGAPIIFPNDFTIDVPTGANEYYVFSATGYTPVTIQSSAIIADLNNRIAAGYGNANDTFDYNVSLMPGSGATTSQSNELLLTASAAAAFLLLMSTKKKKRTVGKTDSEDIMPLLIVGGVVVGFSAFKKLFEKLGIINSAEMDSIQKIENDPLSFWKPAFYKQYSSFPRGALTVDEANALLDKITGSFGFFQWSPDIATLTGVFSSLTSKSEVSWLAEIFFRNTGNDLLSYMDDPGTFATGLSAVELTQINNLVSQLPNN